MIRESGRVVAIEDDCLWVETIRQSSCASCSAKKACGHGLLNQRSNGQRNQLRVLAGDVDLTGFAVNDEVEFCIEEHVLVFAALLVYILPLLMMLAGALLVSQWWQSDIIALVGALLGLGAGFITVKVYSFKNQHNRVLQPVLNGGKLLRDHSSAQPIQPF